MDSTIQAELERQQSTMLDKLSSIIDNKLESMKRELEESSNTQMSELKKIRLTEARTLKKKGHEQQYKHNEHVKSAVNEAKDFQRGVHNWTTEFFHYTILFLMKILPFTQAFHLMLFLWQHTRI